MTEAETKSSTAFFAANDSHEELQETQAFLHSGHTTRREWRKRWSFSVIGNWVLGVLLLVFLVIIEIQERRLNELGSGSSFEEGYATDFVLAKSIIAKEEVSFTGGLLYDQNGTLYRDVNENQPQYVGLPGPNIDAAWRSLMSGLEIVFEGKEAEDANLPGNTIEDSDGHSFRLSLDVYHSLHCVNLVRQALDVDYYHRNNEDAHVYRLHTDHCLDYLRQTIQCAGDLTPLYYQFSEFRGRGFPVWGSKHTCRNFRKIDDWAQARHRDQPEGGPAHGGH